MELILLRVKFLGVLFASLSILLHLEFGESFRSQLLMKTSQSKTFSNKGLKISKGAGFSAKSQSSSLKAKQEIKDLLTQYGGDMNSMTNFLFKRKLLDLGKKDPSLYKEIVETLGTKEIDGTQQSPDRTKAHNKLIELTWDVVALTIPFTERQSVPKSVSNRLTSIAKSCVSGGNVLDVGCGHGVLIPYLTPKKPKGPGIKENQIYGVDVSSEMISCAQTLYPRCNFYHLDYFSVDKKLRRSEEQKIGFDSIIFNGSLQFFSDIPETIFYAARLLRKDENENIANGSRIIIAHANGSKFVQEERQKNPHTVKNDMPSFDKIQEICDSVDMKVVGGNIENLEDFYLLVLEKK